MYLNHAYACHDMKTNTQLYQSHLQIEATENISIANYTRKMNIYVHSNVIFLHSFELVS